MSSEAQPIRQYGELIDALVARRIELGLSQMVLDERTGLPSGYVGKLEAWLHKESGRGIGPVSLPLILEALGLAIVLVRTDPPPRLGNMRRRKDDDPGARIPLFKRMARKGAAARQASLSPERRSEIAKGAANWRWHRKACGKHRQPRITRHPAQ